MTPDATAGSASASAPALALQQKTAAATLPVSAVVPLPAALPIVDAAARIPIVLAALRDGKISAQEAGYYLRSVCGTTLEQARPATAPSRPSSSFVRNVVIALALIAFLGVLGVFLFTGGLPLAGQAVIDYPQEPDGLVLPSSTGVRVWGALIGEGDATITLETQSGPLVVAHITSDDGSPRTDRASYAPGEPIAVQHAPADATYYLDDGTMNTPVTLPLPAPQADSTLLIVAGTTEVPVTYRLPIIIGDAQRETAFSGACLETCTMPAAEGTLRLSEGATVRIDRIETVQVQNSPPVQAIAFTPLTVSQPTTIELDNHFTDADNDPLTYVASGDTIVSATIDGSRMTLTPLSDGTTTITLYASDLRELTPVTIEITSLLSPAPTDTTNSMNTSTNGTTPPPDVPIAIGDVATNETNQTVPGVGGTGTVSNETNQTGTDVDQTPTDIASPTDTLLPTETTPQTDTTLQTTIPSPVNSTTTVTLPTAACDDPDPNRRPLACVERDTVLFDEEIYLEDEQRNAVARITPIGNLVIRGRTFTDSTATAENGVFRIGYKDADFAYVTTVWIDADGNLHARGTITEETEQLTPASGMYAAMNRRGVYLLIADPRTGDVWLRGNVIMFREDIRG